MIFKNPIFEKPLTPHPYVSLSASPVLQLAIPFSPCVALLLILL
jgi:hypothetical protein